jgi:hypothetical protein
MDIQLVALIASLGAGAFAAAIGGLPAFIFTGFMVFIGVAVNLAGAPGGDLSAPFDFLGNVAFGPVFGPHIAFGGAVAAVAYAARSTDVEGRDIAAPLAGYARPDILAVGAIFGAAAYIVQLFFANVLDGATWTDTVALTVTLSAFATRLIFGRTGLFGSPSEEAKQTGRMGISADAVWVGHQSTPPMIVTLGAAAGLISSFFVIQVFGYSPEIAATVPTLLFGIAAVSLILLQIGANGPVTHHMVLPAGVATITALNAGDASGVAMLFGVLAGIAGGLIGELAARVFLIHGDTHIDPPAVAIAIMTFLILMLDKIF